MELRSTSFISKEQKLESKTTRRKHQRYRYLRVADWDYFTSGTGVKAGFLENISEGGCLFRTVEPIEHRRWVRMVVKEPSSNILSVLVGRVIRREDKTEAWSDDQITLYRYGVEFIQALNPVLMSKIKEPHTVCAVCGDSSANIPDLTEADVLYCVLCHLRRACHNLLVQDGLDDMA